MARPWPTRGGGHRAAGEPSRAPREETGPAGVPWSWWGVLAIVFVSFAVRAWLSRTMLGPFIFVDELIYSEVAKSIASGSEPAIRGVQALGYPPLYPALISPAYAAFDSVPDAYAAVKIINSLVMSLAAVPAYVVARRVVGARLALGAAALAVALPSMAYTSTVMTESLFYPVVLVFSLLLLRALETPTWGRSLLVLAGLAVAGATRTQAVALVPVVLTAPLLLAVFGGGLRRLWSYGRLYAVLVGPGVLVLLVEVARGRSPRGLLGAYSVVGDRSYDVGTVAHYWLWHLEETTLYLVVVPVVALLVLLSRVRRLPPRLQAHLAVTVAMVFWVTLVVAAFASQFASRIQERNVFFVAPLVLVALLAWIELGAPRPPVTTLAATAGAVALVGSFPYGRFIDTSAVSDTLALLPIWSSNSHYLFGSVVWTVLAVALAVSAVLLLVPRRFALAVPLVVAAVLLCLSWRVWSGYPGIERAGAGALFQGIRAVPRDWIDRAVPPGRDVSVLWTGKVDRFTVNQNEFFNRRVGDVFYTDVPTPGGSGERPVALDAATRVLELDDGKPLRAEYLLADGSVEPDGALVARDAGTGIALWRVDGVVRLAKTIVTGVDDDLWSGPTVTWRREACTGGVLAVTLSGDARLFPGGQTVTATGGARVRVPPNAQATLRIRVRPVDRTCTVRFEVSPTARPVDTLPDSTDPRRLGTHFTAFVYRPSRR